MTAAVGQGKSPEGKSPERPSPVPQPKMLVIELLDREEQLVGYLYKLVSSTGEEIETIHVTDHDANPFDRDKHDRIARRIFLMRMGRL